MPNDMAYYPVTRRKLVNRLRDIKRTIEKIRYNLELASRLPWETDLQKQIGLLDGALAHCDMMREDLDICRTQPRKKPRRRVTNVT